MDCAGYKIPESKRLSQNTRRYRQQQLIPKQGLEVGAVGFQADTGIAAIRRRAFGVGSVGRKLLRQGRTKTFENRNVETAFHNGQAIQDDVVRQPIGFIHVTCPVHRYPTR